MKIALIIFISIIAIVLIYFFYLGYTSQTGTANGIVNSKLTPCSKKPNCICTEFAEDNAHFIEPVTSQSTSINNVITAIETTGGKIINTRSNYIYATYTSRIFRYVDDFEVRIDAENKLIHIRSASRVGHSDMGANLKRIEKVKQILGDIK